MKYWEIIADRLHAEGWSYGIAKHFTQHGFLYCVDAHRDGKRFMLAAKRFGGNLRAIHTPMKAKIISSLAIVITAALVSQPLFAVPTTYVYTGNPFTTVISPYTTSDRVTATVELASPLAANMPLSGVTPLAFSLSDGVQTITNLTATFSTFSFSTDATGAINSWLVPVDTNTGGISTNNAPGFTVFDNGGVFGFNQPFALNNDTPGSWSSRASIPDAASTISLLSLSLAALGLVALRFKRSAA